MRSLSPFERKRFRTASIFLLVLPATGAWTIGCGGGGAGPSVPPPPPPLSITVTISPKSGSVMLGNALPFSVKVANTTDIAVSWSVNGAPGGNATAGTITPDGVYTAPAVLPASATVQITATSHTDATKSDSAAATIVSDTAISVAPNPASVELGATQSFHSSVASSGHPDSSTRWSLSGVACPSGCGSVDATGTYTAPQILPSLAIVATLTAIPGSNPNNVLAWSLSGPGCSGASCGTISGTTTQTQSGNVTTASALYTAPATAPNPNSVTITATPQADPSKKAQATLSILPGTNVSLSPPAATLAASHRITLTAQVNGTPNTGLNWSVNGIAGGNAALGRICVVGSNPCQAVTSNTSLQADYVAPGAIPSPNPVGVTAASAADATKSASAQITVINHVVVSVQPASVTLTPLAAQGFTASVLGTSNQNVVWQVQGAACAGSGVCGSIDANGTYTAPSSAPTPNAVQVVAISSDDTSQSGVANVTITTGANVLNLHPSSVYAGAAQGFTLRVEGSGFAASTPGPGSVVLVGGTSRTTACNTALSCAAPVTAADVAVAGSVSVQIQNPDGKKSNAVSLVVAAPNSSDEVIALSSAAPTASGKDIVVVEPTTAGVSVPGNDFDLDVAALGAFSTTNNSCTLGGNAIPLPRPASGTSTADICVFSQSGFDTSMAYTVSGPGDVAVISKQPAGLGIIHLTLQVPASAAPSARTLFI